jgi:hypothetical protein
VGSTPTGGTPPYHPQWSPELPERGQGAIGGCLVASSQVRCSAAVRALYVPKLCLAQPGLRYSIPNTCATPQSAPLWAQSRKRKRGRQRHSGSESGTRNRLRMVRTFCTAWTFCTSSSRADTARTRRRFPPAMRSLPLRSASAPGGWRATRGPGSNPPVVTPGQGGAHCAEPPPSVKPAARPDPAGPSAGPPLSSSHAGGKRVRYGGASGTRSKRLDPGAPTAPRPAIAGRPGACRKWRAPPLPSFPTHVDLPASIGSII